MDIKRNSANRQHTVYLKNHEVPIKIQGRSSKSITSSITVVWLQLEINIDMRFAYNFLLIKYRKKNMNVSSVSLKNIAMDVSADVELILPIL